MKQTKSLIGALVLTLVLTGQSCSTQVRTQVEGTNEKSNDDGVISAPMPVLGEDTEETIVIPQPEPSVEVETKPETEVKTEPITSTVPTENIVTFNIVAQRFTFTPGELKVKEGQTVVINLTSKDTSHGLKIKEFDVNLIVPQDQTQSVTFVADKKGTFTFSCSVYCGSGHLGMTGTLIVE